MVNSNNNKKFECFINSKWFNNLYKIKCVYEDLLKGVRKCLLEINLIFFTLVNLRNCQNNI